MSATFNDFRVGDNVVVSERHDNEVWETYYRISDVAAPAKYDPAFNVSVVRLGAKRGIPGEPARYEVTCNVQSWIDGRHSCKIFYLPDRLT